MELKRVCYKRLYQTVKILPRYQHWLKYYVSESFRNSYSYLKAEKKTGVPWQIIASIHSLECAFDMNRQILNGQKWDRKTTISPKNKGPFKNWQESTICAFEMHNYKLCADEISIESVLRFLEKWNGWGYANKGLNSPYLWALSNHGEGVGKFIKDGIYDPKAESKQLGAALLIKELNNYKTVSIFNFINDKYVKS